MTRKVLICAIASLGLTAFAQQPEWQDPNVNAINRAPMHTNYFAYESEQAALKGCRLASDNYMTLNGTWKFNWVENADQRPTDFYKADFNDKVGTTCRFLACGNSTDTAIRFMST